MAQEKKESFTPLTWTTLDYEYREKSREWYIALTVVVVGIALGAFILSNYLFALLVLVAGFAIAVHAEKKPENITCEINDKGIRVNTRLYLFPELASFWVEVEHREPKLFIESKRMLLPHISLSINRDDGQKIRNVLLKKLPEEHHADSFGHAVLDYFGF